MVVDSPLLPSSILRSKKRSTKNQGANKNKGAKLHKATCSNRNNDGVVDDSFGIIVSVNQMKAGR